MKSFSNRYRITYLFFSFLSGIVELGSIIFVLQDNMPIFYMPILGIVYQCGSLFSKPVILNFNYYLCLAVIALIFSFVAYKNIVFLCFSVLLISIALQGIRGLTSEQCSVSTLQKRIFRIFGFAVAGFFSYYFLSSICALVISISLLFLKGWFKWEPVQFSQNTKIDLLGTAMIIHQSHYFSYSSFIPYLFISYHSIPIYYSGVLFIIGWISYSISHLLLGKFQFLFL
jgi:hypothetical protein